MKCYKIILCVFLQIFRFFFALKTMLCIYFVAVICQIGLSARSYCELSCRTEPVIGDVIIALVNMGISIDGIDLHARRPGRTVLPPLVSSTQTKQLSILQAGVKQTHPSYIPTHLPSFPDPHAYIRTPVSLTHTFHCIHSHISTLIISINRNFRP